MKLVEGQLIHNRYRLDRRLAQGGMGEVWKGYDIQLNRVVAIKALRGDLTDVEAKRRRLRIEAHNSADLAHPNIAALFDYYEHDGIGFLIMEFVDSESLADLYHEKGAMDPLELLPILVQVARGLYVAHSHGVIHRDVKPANIMVSKDGQVKITDFGVSYSTNQAQITQDGMVVGTAQYISPEQAQGKKATPQSDIYSLGVVAYEGLCGERPFTGTTPVDIAAAHVNDAVPPMPDTIDVQLKQFVMSMLAKDPRDRPKDALVVSRTLSHIERRLFDQEASFSETTMVSRDGRIARRVVSAPYASDGSVSASPAITPQHKTTVAKKSSSRARVVESTHHVDIGNDEIDDSTLGSETRNAIINGTASTDENAESAKRAETETDDVNKVDTNDASDSTSKGTSENTSGTVTDTADETDTVGETGENSHNQADTGTGAKDEAGAEAGTESETQAEAEAEAESENGTETEAKISSDIMSEFSPAAQAAMQTMTQTLRAITDYQIPAIQTDGSVPVEDKPPQSLPPADTAKAGTSPAASAKTADASSKPTSSPITSNTDTTNPSSDSAEHPATAASDSSKSSSDAAETNVPATEASDQAASTENRKEQQ